MAKSISQPSTLKSKFQILDDEATRPRTTPKFRAKDFHPEIMGSWSKKRLETLEKKKHHPRLQRTAMGEYIPSPNKSPLTLAALPTPSAFDYQPTFEREGPKYTIGKKFRVWKKSPTPGPADYVKLKDFYNPCKAPTMKSRAAFTDSPSSKIKIVISVPHCYETYCVFFNHTGKRRLRDKCYNVSSATIVHFWLKFDVSGCKDLAYTVRCKTVRCSYNFVAVHTLLSTFFVIEAKRKTADPASYLLPSTLRQNGATISSRPPDGNNVGMLPGYPYPYPGRDNVAGYCGRMPTLEKGVKFGIIPKKLTKDEFPGPIYKVPPMFPEGSKFQFLTRRPWPPKVTGWDAPAPNQYLPRSELGKGGKFPRVSHRLPSIFQGNKVGPGPCRYAVFKPKLGAPITMGQLPLPSRFPRQPVPAPNSYLVEPLLLPKQSKTTYRSKFLRLAKPRPRIRGPKIISRQETMITLRYSALENEPSPSIHLCYFKEEKFGSGTPGARIRSRPAEHKGDRKIAPNEYNPCTDPKLKRIPAYTFGHKIMSKSVPLTLNVEPRPLPSTVELKNQFTFGFPLTQPVNVMPSPTKYSVPSTFDSSKTQPRRGASFKGRQTPFVHHGIAKLKIPVTPTRMFYRLK